jgi:hypothetical protein
LFRHDLAEAFEGRSFKEMAAETGASVNTLLSRKRYAVRHRPFHQREQGAMKIDRRDFAGGFCRDRLMGRRSRGSLSVNTCSIPARSARRERLA